MKYKHQNTEVPEETARVAKKVFKNGNKYLRLRDELGVVFANEQFGHLFKHAGRRAESPGNLAVTLVVQFLEKASDRKIAEQVGARIDLKYLLGLELDAPGMRHQALGEFRQRLVEGGDEEQLLTLILDRFRELGLLKERQQQRTDATYILSAARDLTRLQVVWETLSVVVEQMAWWAPEWLRQQITPEWVDLYARPEGWHRFPKKKEEREALAQQIGQDGYNLWQRLMASPFYEAWRAEAAIETWRQVWLQQYYFQEGQVQWRDKKDLPPAALAIATPHDVDARYSRQQRGQGHVGYQVHYTEIAAEREQPCLIVEVTTTPAPVPDSQVLPAIQQALDDKGLAPEQQLVDSGYVSGANLVASDRDHEIDLYGPAQSDTSWQKREETGYDLAQFDINWTEKQVTCPQGKVARSWSETTHRGGQKRINVRFPIGACRPCSAHELCTRGQSRTVSLRPQAEQEALTRARQRQAQDAFKETYRLRAGVEALISHAASWLGSRRSRYVGLAKTHLHNVLTAVALNVHRFTRWRMGYKRARTRRSPLQQPGFI